MSPGRRARRSEQRERGRKAGRHISPLVAPSAIYPPTIGLSSDGDLKLLDSSLAHAGYRTQQGAFPSSSAIGVLFAIYKRMGSPEESSSLEKLTHCSALHPHFAVPSVPLNDKTAVQKLDSGG
jgi:hypothetical protein